jgi:hypothetical protein
MLTYQLLRPFGYIVIHHPVKRIVDWYVPAVLLGISLIAIMPFRDGMNVWASSGLIASAQGFVQGLPGFYIAALAAVATFGAPGTSLDKVIPDPTPTLATRFAGTWVDMKLSRRKFLCFLFSYLTALSIVLSLYAYYAQSVAVPARRLLPNAVDALSLIALMIYVYFLFQLVVITLWGLYYLGDRMHQPDPHNSTTP